MYNELQNQECNCQAPTQWLSNQDSFRNMFENYMNDITNKFNNKLKNNTMANIFVNNDFTKYMKFMYDSYPANFTNEIKKHMKEFRYSDGSEIYYKLIKK